MRSLAHRPRRSIAVLVALAALALSLAVISRPIVPARADDSQDVTIAEATAQAAETGQPVLATAETTETSSVVANPDGTLTATLGAGPLQEPDASSDTGWSPIDLTLQHVDGTYAPAVSAADTTFSDGGSGALASLDQGSTTYTENWDGTLPTPTVSGDTATYANVLPNIDIVMTAQTTGFKQSFVVKAAPTQQLTLDVPLSLRGLTATVDDNGNLILTDAGGNTVATAGTAVMYGAAMGPTGEPTISATVDTAIVNGQHGPVFEISPDPSFFSNPDLTYPVVIDPSPNLDVTYDTYVRESTPTTSYLTENGLKVGLVASSDITRALLKFPALDTTYRGNSNAIDVSSATLNLYEADSGSCTASEIDLYDVTSNWITLTPVNWNSQPTIGTLYASASFAYGHSGSCPAQTVTISTGGASGHTLKDLVQNWADGTSNYGLELKAANESATSDYKKFRSSEYGSNPPTLSVTYNTLPDVPTSQATEFPQANPVLHAIFSDPDGGTGQALYTVYDASSATIVLDAAGSTVSSGSDSVYTIPSATLTDGELYTWTARSYDGTDYSAPTPEVDQVATSLSEDDVDLANVVDGVNPWGCRLKVLWPHPSSSSPKYIKAWSQTNCVSLPPSGMVNEHKQDLYRSSWRGWIHVGYDDSVCDSGTHSSGQLGPTCQPTYTAPRVQAYVWWDCVDDGYYLDEYNYLQVDSSTLTAGGTTYLAAGRNQTGNWNEDGRYDFRCGKYYSP